MTIHLNIDSRDPLEAGDEWFVHGSWSKIPASMAGSIAGDYKPFVNFRRSVPHTDPIISTNRRLNRRCQELESLLARKTTKLYTNECYYCESTKAQFQRKYNRHRASVRAQLRKCDPTEPQQKLLWDLVTESDDSDRHHKEGDYSL